MFVKNEIVWDSLHEMIAIINWCENSPVSKAYASAGVEKSAGVSFYDPYNSKFGSIGGTVVPVFLLKKDTIGALLYG